MLEDQNILIIGGAGFVGSTLTEVLAPTNNVWVLDNYFTGSRDLQHDGVRYIEGEARDINCLLDTDDFNPEFVFHLGEYSRVEQSFDDIDLVFLYNYCSVYEVLKYIRSKSAKLIYAGSSTKFGDGGDSAYASPYAWTKKTNTDLIVTYSNWFGIDYAITYFYNVYGPREISEGRYATVVGKFLRAVRAGAKTLPVVSPGSQRRNFTHVDDVVRGLITVAKSGYGDDYGIGSDESYSVEELVSLLGCSPEYIPERRGNRLTGPVVSEKTKLLGWKCRETLKSYLESQAMLIKSP